MTTVLVTGGAGYIGSHVLLALLEKGHSPVVIDDLSTGQRRAVPAGVPFHQGDVADAALVRQVMGEHGARAVMHFAGSIVVPESVRDPVKYYRNNVSGSLELIDAARKAGADRFIFSSTATVYGLPETIPIPEDSPTVPISPYAWSKLMVERMLLDLAAAEPDFRPVCLRYFNVAGADPEGRTGQQGPQSTHLVRVASEVATGQRPMLEINGRDYPTRDGTCERDYIHVSDLAEAHVAALDYLDAGGGTQVMNCGTGEGATVLEVIDAVETVLGRPLPKRDAPRREGDAPRLVCDPSRINTLLGWRPTRSSLPEIVASALAWQEKLAAA